MAPTGQAPRTKGTAAAATTPSRPQRRRGRPAGRDTADTRTTILDAAQRCFAGVGYEAASIRTIADEADLTSAAIYNHFSSKAHLYAAVFEACDRQLEETLRTAAERSAGAEVSVRIVSMWAAVADLSRRQPGATEFLVSSPLEVMHSPELQALLPLIDGANFRVLRDVFEEGQAAGELRTDVSATHLARAVAVFTFGVSAHVAVHGGADAVEPGFAQAVYELLRHGMAGPEATR